MAPNVGQIMSLLNATKGSTMRFTLGKGTLQHLASQANDDAAKVLQRALSGATNPTVEIAAKSSEQGYTIAGMIFRDGEKQLGRGAVSVTGFGRPDAVWKTKFSLLDGKVQAGGHLDIGRSPDIDNIAYNIANRNGQLTFNGVGNNSHGYALVNTKAIMNAAEPGTYNELIGGINQPMARFMQGLRNWSTGEGSFGWWKEPLRFTKLVKELSPDQFRKITDETLAQKTLGSVKATDWKLKDMEPFDLGKFKFKDPGTILTHENAKKLALDPEELKKVIKG